MLIRWRDRPRALGMRLRWWRCVGRIGRSCSSNRAPESGVLPYKEGFGGLGACGASRRARARRGAARRVTCQTSCHLCVVVTLILIQSTSAWAAAMGRGRIATHNTAERLPSRGASFKRTDVYHSNEPMAGSPATRHRILDILRPRRGRPSMGGARDERLPAVPVGALKIPSTCRA